MATARRTSVEFNSYRSRAQIIQKGQGRHGLIHRLDWADLERAPAQPVNKSGEPIRGIDSTGLIRWQKSLRRAADA